MACGKVEKQDGEASLETPIVASSLAGDGFVCHAGGEPIALGAVTRLLLAPNGQRLAVERSGGVELVSLSDASSERLAGDEATLEGARWSYDSERLAYFAGSVPHVTSGAGAPEFVVEVELPKTAEPFSYRAAQWSRDGRQLAFISAHTGILADARGERFHIFSERMLETYAPPWTLAFSADGAFLAGLEQLAGDERSVVMLDTEALTTQQIVLGFHYTLAGWTADDAAVAVWANETELLPRDGSEPRTFPGYALPSPTKPEIAVPDQGLRIVDLSDGRERNLLYAEYSLSAFRWLADGQSLAVRGNSLENSGYLSAVDGNTLVSGFGVVGPDAWVALPELAHPESGVRTMNLYDARAKGAHFSMEFADERVGGELVGPSRVRWLTSGSLAFISKDELHLATRNGSSNRVLCTGVATLEPPQAGHLD